MSAFLPQRAQWIRKEPAPAQAGDAKAFQQEKRPLPAKAGIAPGQACVLCEILCALCGKSLA
jgi:hypothetical protein